MADLEIFAKIDDVFEMLMAKMGYEIPEYRLERYIKLHVQTDEANLKETYTVTGIDKERNPLNYLTDIKVNGNSSN